MKVTVNGITIVSDKNIDVDYELRRNNSVDFFWEGTLEKAFSLRHDGIEGWLYQFSYDSEEEYVSECMFNGTEDLLEWILATSI